MAKDDLGAYFANRLRALRSDPSAFLTTYEEELARGSAHFERTLLHSGNERAIFGAVDGGNVIGTLGIFREDRARIDHKATIWGMHVDNQHRGKGLGAGLLDFAIQFAKEEMKVKTVGLCVESSNHAARALYDSRGFHCWGTEPFALRSVAGEYFSEDHMILVFGDVPVL